MISPSILKPLRDKALTLFKAGVNAADPYQAVSRCLSMHGDKLLITLGEHDKKRSGRWLKIHVIAFGKAACPMLQAALDAIPADLTGQKIAVTNYENVQTMAGVEVIGAGHPLPDKNGLAAAKRCAGIAQNAKADELVLVLISGGGSALIPYPVESITLTDKFQTTQLLLACGATINEINCIRKHLSQLKGGGLSRMIAPADCHSLILSDVIGDDLSAIASGPTVPDETTFADAVTILKVKNIWNKLPEHVRRYLSLGQQGKVPETPKAGDACFANAGHSLIGSNRISVNAIIPAAQEAGFETMPYSENLCGEAKDVAEKLVLFAKEIILSVQNRSLAIVAGGETTVTLKGKGKGGRNQELALAFAIQADKLKLEGKWVFLSGGTDGRDGPTDAAGGLVDFGTIQRLRDRGLNPNELLANNDSYTALKQADDLLITGTTGTNVADLQIFLVF